MPQEQSMEWKGTQLALKHAALVEKYPQLGLNQPETYQGRPIIARDTRIQGGVYFINGYEAVVVDDSKDAHIKAVFDELEQQVQKLKPTGYHYEQKVLRLVQATVARVMPYDHGDNRAKKYHEKYGKNYKIILGSFIGAGVCRHQALLAGYIIEKLIDHQLLTGTVSVDRNWPKDDPIGHAWTRYTSSSEEVFILDVAQNYFGKLSMWIRPHWNYARPEELEKYKHVLIRIKEFITKQTTKKSPTASNDETIFFKISSLTKQLFATS